MLPDAILVLWAALQIAKGAAYISQRLQLDLLDPPPEFRAPHKTPRRAKVQVLTTPSLPPSLPPLLLHECSCITSSSNTVVDVRRDCFKLEKTIASVCILTIILTLSFLVRCCLAMVTMPVEIKGRCCLGRHASVSCCHGYVQRPGRLRSGTDGW